MQPSNPNQDLENIKLNTNKSNSGLPNAEPLIREMFRILDIESEIVQDRTVGRMTINEYYKLYIALTEKLGVQQRFVYNGSRIERKENLEQIAREAGKSDEWRQLFGDLAVQQ